MPQNHVQVNGYIDSSTGNIKVTAIHVLSHIKMQTDHKVRFDNRKSNTGWIFKSE